jgi:molybdopterin-dependent oxidoreductase alpha subunit
MKATELTPEAFTGLKLKKRDTKAVGMPGVIATIGQMAKYMNPADAVTTMFAINQKGGFDCPGCAWPDPDDDRSKLGEYCENGIKAIAEEASAKKIGAKFFKKNSIEALSQLSDFELGKSGRISEPMVLNGSHYEPISWDNAMNMIADELVALDSPDESIFYTSGRASNEAAFLYQLFIRQFGTNNMPDCSNMCHESSGKGLNSTIGIGKGTVRLNDFDKADLVIVIGQNPGTNHPRMLSALEKCKENGGKIIAINPLPEAGLLHFTNPQSITKMLTGGTPLADLFLQVKINGDVALLKAMMLHLVELQKTDASIFDTTFIDSKTVGFSDFLENLKKENFDTLAEQCGVAPALIREAAVWASKTQKIIICWAMGLTQHKNAVTNVREIVNLLLMRGAIGREGAGACPVRGHSNVQGDRTMGIWEAPKPAFLDKLEQVFGIQAPRKNGFHVVEAIEAMHDGRGKVFFALGGNFLSATPDTSFTADALRNTRMTVHVSTKLNRSHLITGKKALILPCLGRTDADKQAGGEQFVTCENSMGVVQRSQGVLTPPSSQLKSEVWIVANLAKAVFQKQKRAGLTASEWEQLPHNYDAIRELIEKSVAGFTDFNKKVRRPEGFYLPNPQRDEQRFQTDAGEKAKFTVTKTPHWILNHGEYLMMTVRSHDQFNTTIYGLNDRYRGVLNERRVIFMNEKDMTTEGVKSGDVVNLFSHFNGVERTSPRFIVVPYDIPQGNVCTYFPEANTLIPIDSFADESHTPNSKSVIITMTKAIA